MKFFTIEISQTEAWMLILFLFFTLIQLIYYIFTFSRILFYKNGPVNLVKHPLSVIICAKNEAFNLARNLPKILEQDYPDFEVIVVNDASVDDTDEVLYELKRKYSNLKTTSLVDDKKFSHGKKLAMTVGIKAAKNEWLVFTDADCYPVSNSWLKEISKMQSKETQIVLGYGGYEQRKGFLNKFIRADAFFVAINYLSFALSGKPYMGVGRNLSYRKSLYFKSEGFSRHVHILSGDDDLFVNENANAGNTKVIFTDTSRTLSHPKHKFNQWFRQKKRHLSTAPHYKSRHKFLLGVEPLSRYLFFAFAILLIIFAQTLVLQITIGVVVFRLIVQSLVFKIAQNRLNEKYLFLTSLLMDFLLPFIILFAHLSNKISDNKNKWI